MAYTQPMKNTFPTPQSALQPNTAAFESNPLIKPTGFREYDARWLFMGMEPKNKGQSELNLMGVHALGQGLGTLIHEMGLEPTLVTGHDFRSYSSSIKFALISGLMNTGIQVKDIGLAVTPMAYYGQFALGCQAVAQVTASHNENGWTGIKMGVNKPLTFGPAEMQRLKEITLSAAFTPKSGGSYTFVPNFAEAYAQHLTQSRKPYSRKIKAIVACGNGTAGFIAPQVLRKLGVDVVELNTNLDHTFPNYNPNPEDLKMLHAMADAVKEHKADIALGFDGDGDRCGVVMDNGHEIYADTLGVLLARNLAKAHKNAQFVVDVKSTGLYHTDPVLKELGAQTDYWKTGHSYIKRRVNELGAIAGFEKSGHFFFNPPYGLGYDDALVSAIAVLDMLENNPTQSISQLAGSLAKTWQSPTMSPHCPDEEKYQVLEKIIQHMQTQTHLIGQKIISLNTVNGIRFTVEDGTWGLIRASSNKPELVVVVESPVSEANRNAIFAEIEKVLAMHPQIGAFNQKLA